MDVHEQRVRFVVEATQKRQTFRGLCAAYEISRPTGYLWLRRYRECGVEGIAERSRKPHHSPERTDAERERQVVQLRQRYPDWGSRKLKVLLARQGVELPRHDLVRDAIRAMRPRNASSVGSPTNCGRWTSKAPRDGRRASGRCRCWTTTAVI